MTSLLELQYRRTPVKIIRHRRKSEPTFKILRLKQSGQQHQAISRHQGGLLKHHPITIFPTQKSSVKHAAVEGSKRRLGSVPSYTSVITNLSFETRMLRHLSAALVSFPNRDRIPSMSLQFTDTNKPFKTVQHVPYGPTLVTDDIHGLEWLCDITARSGVF